MIIDFLWNMYSQIFYGTLILWLFFMQYVWLVKHIKKDSFWYKPAVTLIGFMYLGDLFFNNWPNYGPLLFLQKPEFAGYYSYNLLGIQIKIPRLAPLTYRLQHNIRERKQGRTLLWVTQYQLSVFICRYMIEPQRWGQPGHCD